ncbi:transposable element Tc1 transposase [Trichonephila clavipes]|nr:transposable element Tc1 transposase [Trichonephila clavipes]
MTFQRYIDEVLLPHVRLFRGAVGNKFVFMDDNATCHRTLAVQDCLDSDGIQSFVWPARSPDLNPIENVWDALGRQVAGRNYPPTNKNTLIRALTEEWDKLLQQLLDNVVQSAWNLKPVASRSRADGSLSNEIIRNRFHEVQLRARVPATGVSLTAQHRARCLVSCHSHRTWTIEWHQVLFMNESHFSLWRNDGCRCV